ncbi:hypothetical protein PILCRDRAFT_815408 [Piloderma croceum F 1598]|uniref:Cytochrome P450 n=1 Tax=Piloderma croceum (strain F 1598) TaxID=765440 RepID=A0A0C3G561_PILCF|nr:hypothetical protein PILCRDRAFT_815408 [Piloderma croceum F 1598]
MAPTQQLGFIDASLLLVGLWLSLKVIRILLRGPKNTQLNGPPSESWIFGFSHFTNTEDPSVAYEQWAEQYGAVFRIPIAIYLSITSRLAIGQTKIIICDPKAIQHIYSKSTYGYVNSQLRKNELNSIMGKGILLAEGDIHKRQRKSLTPAFSNVAIRQLTPVFIDSAYKVKVAWDALLDSNVNGETAIDVQGWMNHLSLDSLGIAGFSHDFGTIQGKHSVIAEVLDSFSMIKMSSVETFKLVLGLAFPILTHIPTQRKNLFKKFRYKTEEISKGLVERTRKEKEGDVENKQDRSVIRLLIKSSSDSLEHPMSEEEVIAQMTSLIVAGYNTTSITLTWALIELARNQSVQTKLREELTCQYRNAGDPTYDQFINGLPYLDAVTNEVLRMHSGSWETIRVAAKDDVIPLSVPIQTADNKTVDCISVTAGQVVSIPIRSANRSERFWGTDAKEFKPERWIEGDMQGDMTKIQGYRHLLSFGDGPRMCLGKPFALAAFKATLSVLVRNFAFELRDGPNTKLEIGRVLALRPKIVGEEECRMPLRVRRVD